ncbi:uncharacterized protein K02A2.6-like [Argiope bruennichi]|uniref:CCHC-type domain-containing protein n=1 Tax=Argiope bruennichi TaxID=94029 RepID=A0A8T0FN63_ARGBR|nr:uncharacterized protein K02A2.6-like [Argiope bruennichi]KAF8791648.1 hypothetical protein HNY73_006488 [Argiope bruennichi]
MTKELATRMGSSNICFESYDASVEDWSSYVERLESYFVVNGIEDKIKVPAILSLMGATTYKLLKNLATPNIPSELTYQDIVKLLSEHLNPKPLEMTERFRFYKRKQFEGESIANYCAELQKLSIHCNFGNNLSTMLRDKLVMGLKNENIQKKLLAEDKLTYEKAKSIAFAMESAQRDVCEIQNQMVSIKKLHSSQDKTIKKDFSKFKKSEPTKKFDKSRKCYRCDSTQHLAHKCKHKNTQCRNCLKNGHLAKVCRSKRNETVKQIESCSETVPVNSVKSPRHARDKILLEIFVEGNKCLFELDTGAAISCMNVNEFKKLCPDVAIKPTKLLLRNFDNSMITSAGQAVVQIQYKDQINTETIYLVHAKVNAVFGREWLRNFQLDWSSIKAVRVGNCNSRTNKLNILLQKYEKIFSPGIGKLEKFCCRLQMKPNYKPVFFKPRPVPFALKERIETELKRLVAEDIIEPVTYSEWATPIVPVIKQNGNLRICGDYKVTINPGLKIEQYPLPRIEDIFAELSGGEFFTKIDLSEAYLQMLVDERDRHLLTINTHKEILTERIVQLFKASLKSSRGDSGDLNVKLQRFLLQYRITPHSLTGETPSALFLKRCIRTRLDLFKPNLRDKVVQKQSSRLDTESILREFQEGEKVAVRNYSGPNKWKIGTIINRDGTLSYSIQVGTEIWKRHVDQIRKCGKSIELSQADTEIPIYDKELNFPDEPVSDDVAESEPPAPVPEVVPEPKDVPVSATPSDDMPPGPVPDASGKPKTDVPLRRSNRIRRPPERLVL